MAIENFWTYPPRPFLDQVHNHCPEAASTYCDLWDKKDKKNKVLLDKKEISFFIHINAFKRDLRKLFREGLINYDERDTKICIEMVDWGDIE